MKIVAVERLDEKAHRWCAEPHERFDDVVAGVLLAEEAGKGDGNRRVTKPAEHHHQIAHRLACGPFDGPEHAMHPGGRNPAPDEILDFFGEARWVAHNATFDMGFVNAEFARLGLPPIAVDRVTDTLALARRKHPMGPNSLDALCRRYGIDNSHRAKHGALLDSELLAEVYIEMIGGRQAALGLVSTKSAGQSIELDDAPIVRILDFSDRAAVARAIERSLAGEGLVM